MAEGGRCASDAVTLALFTRPPGTLLQRQKRPERPSLHRGSPPPVLHVLLWAVPRLGDSSGPQMQVLFLALQPLITPANKALTVITYMAYVPWLE